MAIKKRTREWVLEILETLDIDVKVQQINNREATVLFRGEELRFSLEKLPNRPSANDVLVAITRTYSNRTRG